MSNPLIVTDKSPKHLLAIQRYVMNSQRYVGGVDTTIWGSKLPTDKYAISGGTRNGEILDANDYGFVVSAEGVTLTLTVPLTDGRVVLYPAIAGYTVTKLSNSVWRAERTATLTVVGGIDDGLPVSWEERANLAGAIYPHNGATAGPLGGITLVASDAYQAVRVPYSGSPSATVQIEVLVACVSRPSWGFGAGSDLGCSWRGLWTLGVSQEVVPAGAGRWRMRIHGAFYDGGIAAIAEVFRGPGHSAQALEVLMMTVGVDGQPWGRMLPPSYVGPDATLGPVQPDGSRTVTLTQGTHDLSWSDEPVNYRIVKLDERNYKIVYTGDIVDPILVEVDLNAVIDANEMLELRGELTVYNDLTINGKLYITQELGF